MQLKMPKKKRKKMLKMNQKRRVRMIAKPKMKKNNKLNNKDS